MILFPLQQKTLFCVKKKKKKKKKRRGSLANMRLFSSQDKSLDIQPINPEFVQIVIGIISEELESCTHKKKKKIERLS